MLHLQDRTHTVVSFLERLDKIDVHVLLPFDETVISDRAVLNLLLPVPALEPPPQSRICTVPH